MALRSIGRQLSDYLRPVIAPEPAEERASTGIDAFATSAKTTARRLGWRADRVTPVLFALVLALVGLGLLAVHFERPYTSDDVAAQNLLANWQPSGAGTVWISPDTWALKYPLYLLVGLLLPNSPGTLLATALVLNVIGFGLYFLAYRHFVGRRPRLDEYLPILWLTTLGLTFYEFLINPNLRNAEIGLGFIMIVLVSRYVTDQGWSGARAEWTRLRVARTAAMAAGGVALTGLLVYSDPLYLYLFILPLGLALCTRLLWGGNWREGAALVVLGLTVPVASLWAAGVDQLRFSIVKYEPRFVTLDELGTHVTLAIQGLVTLFHADFFGRPPLGISTVGVLINFGLLALIFATPRLVRVLHRQLSWWQWFIILQPHFVLLVFLMSNQAVGQDSYHYLILIPFYGAISLAFLAGASPNVRVRLLFIAVLLASIAFNSAPVARTLAGGYQNPNVRDYAIIQAAREHGSTKGYAEYWSSNISTYLSGEQIQFIQTLCEPDSVHFYAWLIDDAALSRPVTRSFYISDSHEGTAACGPTALAQEFGSPADVITIDDHTTMYVYDYDITARLQSPPIH